MSQDRGQQLSRFDETPLPHLTARLFSRSRPDNGDTVPCERRHVAPRRRVLPHLPVHRRRNHQRTCRVPCKAKHAQKVIRPPMRKPGDAIGGRRRDQ